MLLLLNIAYSQNVRPLQKALWQAADTSGFIKISVCWDNPSPENKQLRELVRTAITDTWQRSSGLQFTGWGPVSENKSDIHIYINDTLPNTIGLGTEIRYKEHGIVLNFSFVRYAIPGCGNKEQCIRNTAIHEFGHALGFAHQQNRPDCFFEECWEKDNRSDGPWITPCDRSSVMNYCNPTYANDGGLSEFDVTAVRGLYGLPAGMASQYSGLHLVVNSININPLAKGKEISHEFKVYVAGSPKDLAKIDHVMYYLDPLWFSFWQRENTVSNAETNFGVGLGLWRPVYVIAFVFLNDGSEYLTEKVLPYEFLSFTPPAR
jgi:hypothetical protein